MSRKRVIVTADDFGIAPEVNLGIIEGHAQGIVTAASLLTNAPATEHAVALSRQYPSLEVGIHLGIVEGFSLRDVPGTLTDEIRYFGDRICLRRDWKSFVSSYLLSQIDLGELEQELELQIRRFLDFYPSIPFANSTQHLHLLPGVFDLIVRLADRYDIKALRIPREQVDWRHLLGRRSVTSGLLACLGRTARQRLLAERIETTDFCLGFRHSGTVTETSLFQMLQALQPGTSELMTHPGNDCRGLRENLPWGYRDFAWSGELMAVTSPAIRELIENNQIDLIQFRHL